MDDRRQHHGALSGQAYGPSYAKIDRKEDFKAEVSMAKHFVANMLGRIIDQIYIQVHGALGYSTDTPLANMYQHARWARFADGADEVHQMRIAQRTIAAWTDNGSTRSATETCRYNRL